MVWASEGLGGKKMCGCWSQMWVSGCTGWLHESSIVCVWQVLWVAVMLVASCWLACDSRQKTTSVRPIHKTSMVIGCSSIIYMASSDTLSFLCSAIRGCCSLNNRPLTEHLTCLVFDNKSNQVNIQSTNNLTRPRSRLHIVSEKMLELFYVEWLNS